MQQLRARAGCRAGGVYSNRHVEFTTARAAARRGARESATAGARNFTRAVYAPVTLFAGDVVFDGIGMLQAGEFDGEAILDMTHYTPRRLADGDS